jgi:hypothetical protein
MAGDENDGKLRSGLPEPALDLQATHSAGATLSTRQVGPSGSFCRKKSCGVAKDSDCRPTVFNRYRMDARVRASSSTINTFGLSRTVIPPSLILLRRAHEFITFYRGKGRFPWLIASLSLMRALASLAFTVPAGTPKRCAVSRMLKPWMSRNWKVLRKVGDSRDVPSANVVAISWFWYDLSGSGRVSGTNSASGRFCSRLVSSKLICFCTERRRNFMRAELITIVVSHVDNFACPLNWSTCLKANKTASWTASSASATLPR